MKKHLLLLLTLALLISAAPTWAIPFQDATGAIASEGKKMNFQGTLYENGAPVTGERNFTFSIDLGEGESWTETQSNVQVIEGLYAVILGSVTPMPEDLFYGVEGRTLTVSIGNTVLGSTELLSPFSAKPIGPVDDLARRIEVGNGETESDTVFYFKITADNLTQGSSKGIQVDMTGQGVKMALRGNTLSQADDPSTKIAIIGSATGSGTGSHEGVRGQAFGAGRNNAGVLGLAGGPGNGATGYDEGSYNTGVVGYGQSNPWGNTGVSGFAVGGVGVDNIGVVGISNVGTEGDLEVENKGVLGRAEGLGINKAIWARAQNGVENWAGWFEGDLAVVGGKNLNLYGADMAADSLKIQLNYYEPNNSGSVLTFGHNKTRRVMLGSASDRTGGLVHVYDSLDRGVALLRGSSRPGDWVTDKRPNGQLELWGPESQNFYLGARVWEEGGADRGIFQVFGNNVETPQGSGNLSSFEAAVISVQDFGDGAQQGLLQLGKAGANPTILNYDNLSKLVSSVDGNGKYRFEVNAQNSGVLKLMSSVDSVNVLIDSNGPKAGLIYLNDSLGRPNYKMVTYSGGSAYMEMSAGIPDIGESRIVYQHAGYMNPWTNMIARNADGTAKGRVQSGWLSGGGEDFGQFRVSASNNRTLASMGGNETVGGAITLEGPNSPLIHMGSLNWEDNDGPERARISMFGNGSEDDGNGGTYTPERVSLTVGKDAANSEFGTLNLSNSAGGGFEVGSRVWENDNQGGLRSFTALKGTQDVDDGNGGTYRPWLVSQEIQDDGNGEYGTLNVNGTNGSSINLIGGSGDINISGVVNQSSDARLKKNVTTLTSGLSMVNRLRGVRYNWKDESKPEAKIGFIAQEVEEVLPELVKTREDGFKGINYAEMTAVLVEAVKELSAQVEALKAENSTLKAEATKVEAMEDRLAKIEALLLNNQKVNANQK